jgi:hypothetical protein
MTRRFIGPAAVFAGFVFLHLPVEDLFDWLAGRFGFEAYDRVTFAAFTSTGIFLFAAGWLFPRRRRLLIGGSITALLVVMAIVQRLLVVASIENIHYPQYALLFCVLVRARVNIEIAWLATVSLGIVDEIYQYLVLTRGRPEYFDWNDVVLNTLGASLGFVTMLALARKGRSEAHLSSRVVLVAAAVAIAAAFLFDPPVWSPFFSMTPAGHSFHKLSATEAVVVVVALWSWVRASSSGPKRPAK